MLTPPKYFYTVLLLGCTSFLNAQLSLKPNPAASLYFTQTENLSAQESGNSFRQNLFPSSSTTVPETFAFAEFNTQNPDFHSNKETYGPVGTFLIPAESFDKKRFWMGVGTASTIYAIASVGLWEAWYKDYPTGKFQTIDDRGEWGGMDKLGHGYTGYHYARWAHQGLTWAGVKQRNSSLTATGVSLLLQSTIEVMDGFSKNWGFSWWDMGMNVSGAGLFLAQEFAFKEQRINMKMSSWRVKHSEMPIPSSIEGGPSSSVAYWARELYGDNPLERFIKDYNAQTIWLTTNPAVLIGKTPKAPWLNLAVGYSVANVYGAFGNSWRIGDNRYNANALFPRHKEYVLSFDIDLERIPAKHPVLKTVLHLANHFKIPAPAVLLAEGQNKGLEWKWLYY